MSNLLKCEERKTLSTRMAYEEASRCLLCLDAPCSASCPAGTDPAKFIRSVRFLNFDGAAETIRENNALGSLCARLCPTEKYCEKGCLRSGLDKPINIAGIQQFVTDYERANNLQILSKGKSKDKKIAIVGSGPSGLEASAKLATLGYDVDVYEKEDKIGGMLRYGIPEYRLPSDVLDFEIARIVSLGVRFLTNKCVGKDISMETLKKDYSAILMSTGYGVGKMIPPFLNKKGAISALDFLSSLRKEEKMNLPASVVVIGGGDVAMDVVTSLKKLGVARVVDVVYEELNDFKASKNERESGFHLADSIICGYIPVSYDNETIIFKHRFLDSSLTIKAPLVIVAVGQSLDTTGLSLELDKGEVKALGNHLANDKVFFAGDIAHGDKSVVYAVKTGKEAAISIDEYLGGK